MYVVPLAITHQDLLPADRGELEAETTTLRAQRLKEIVVETYSCNWAFPGILTKLSMKEPKNKTLRFRR